MRVLLVGGGGFIGRHVQRALLRFGHEAVRPRLDWFRADEPQAWRRSLAGVDGAIYAAGTILDRVHGRDGWLARLHHQAPLALAQAGVPRLVHLSALCAGDSPYTRSKRAGDDALLALGRPALHVVRPSLVFGEGGATSARLGLLSHFPLWPLPQAMQRCRAQPLRVEDLADALVRLLDAKPSPQARVAAGPQTDTVLGWLRQRRATHSRWPAKALTLPDGLACSAARLGSRLGLKAWNEQIWALLKVDNVAPAEADIAWLPALLGRPLRPVLVGPW